MIKFCLDPGHIKGYNPGAVSGYYEGTAMFRLAQMLKEELEKYDNFSCVLTRNAVTDDPTLEQRGRLAITEKCDVFLSLHSNGFTQESAHGVVLFYSLKLPDSKKLCDKIGNAITELIKASTGTTYYRGSQTKTYPNTTNTDYYGVIRASVKSGSKVKYSFLLEHGFHSNIKECTFLNSDQNLRSLAKKEAEVFAEYFGAAGSIGGSDDAINEGDTVLFAGGPVYTSANATVASTTKSQSVCKVTRKYAGLHPFHLVSDDGGGVYGWVDAASITPQKSPNPGGSAVGTPIIGAATATAAQGRSWAENKGASELFVSLADVFWVVSEAVGINPVVAYCQSAVETGYGRFGGVLDSTFCNSCGMKTNVGGSDTDPNAHQRFSTWEDGISAQVDHLALYAGAKGYPKENTKDPRHFSYIKGKAPTVEALGGCWAPSADYGEKIVALMAQLEATRVIEKTPEEMSVANAVNDGVVTSPEYWLKVLNGTMSASAANVKTLIDKYHAALVAK